MEKSILDLFKLNGHVALIIGGNRGLGLTMAKALAEAGASICIAARSEEENRKVEQAIRQAYGVDCISAVCDVTSEESVKRTVQQTVKQFGKIDILIKLIKFTLVTFKKYMKRKSIRCIDENVFIKPCKRFSNLSTSVSNPEINKSFN